MYQLISSLTEVVVDIIQIQRQAHDKTWLPLLERFTMSSAESFWTFETDKAAHRHITSYAEVWACSLKACRVGEKLYTLLWQAPAPAYLRTLLQQVSQSLCVRVSGGFYKSSNTDI